MKLFSKSTKTTWIIFVALLILISALPIAVGFLWPLLTGVYVNELFVFPYLEVIWLFGLAAWVGLPVEAGCNFIGCSPNIFGWIFVIAGVVIDLIIYYLLAIWVERFFVRRKQSNQQNDLIR